MYFFCLKGNRITPSYVAFSGEQGERLIGDAAKNQLTINPENTIFDAKRLIGRDYTEKSVQDDIKLWPFKVGYFFLKFKVPPPGGGGGLTTYTAYGYNSYNMGTWVQLTT